VPVERRAPIAARYRARLLDHATYRRAPGDVAPPRGDRPELPFLMQFTSGTTGEPKAMSLTQAGLAGKFLRAATVFGFTTGDCIAAGRPWPSLVGMRHMMRAHCVGAAFAQIAIPLNRVELAQAISALGITIVITSPGPFRVLLESPGPPLQLRALRIGGAPVSAQEVHEGRERLCKNLTITYGTNETGTLAILRPDDPPEPEGRVGRLLPDVLCEELGGELRFRVPWMAEGYLGNAAATDARFRDGWFYPGDLGSIDAEGFVTLRGRTDDVINYAGVKILPSAIEAVLRAHPGVADVAVVGLSFPKVGEVPVAFVVPRGATPRAAVEEFCRGRIDGTRLPRAFVRVESLPRNASGKVDREALRRTPVSSIRLGKR
jgi:long-chain acyl-CoA synthetase